MRWLIIIVIYTGIIVIYTGIIVIYTGTPQQVKDTVTKAAEFVNKHIFDNKYQPWNAFFSGSVKGHTVSRSLIHRFRC